MAGQSEHVQVERLRDGKLMIITITEFSNAAVDAWANRVTAYLAEQGQDTARYLVYDASNNLYMASNPVVMTLVR